MTKNLDDRGAACIAKAGNSHHELRSFLSSKQKMVLYLGDKSSLLQCKQEKILDMMTTK